jgi:hypothetical protein
MANCHSTSVVRGIQNVGVLAGSNQAYLMDSFAAGEVIEGQKAGGLAGENTDYINRCYSTSNVSGSDEVGGLVGRNVDGQISNCHAHGNVSGVSDVGGLVGLNWTTSSNAVVSKSYSTGPVTATAYKGGLVGYSISGVVEDSFWDIETSGLTYSGGGVGKTTAQMQKQSTFTNAGWDFFVETANGPNEIWRMCVDDVNYPRLTWEFDRFGDLVCPDGVDNSDLEAMTSEWLKEPFSSDFDFYKDNKIDFPDWAVFAAAWGSTQGSFNYNPACDVDDNGVIDGRDMAAFLHHWLQDSSYKPKADIAPVGGDGIINNKDFNVLAENWMRGF